MNPRFPQCLILLTALCLVFTVSCASISQDTIAAIERPVDCSSAEQDVTFLEDERSGFFGRLFAGITAVLPPGSFIVIIRGIFNSPDGIWTDKWKVAFGSYNRKIDDKVSETRSQCGA